MGSTIVSLTANDFGGWPFLDPSLNESALLTAVACVRWHRWRGKDGRPFSSELQDVLQPGLAAEIRKLDLTVNLPSEPLPIERLGRVVETVSALACRHPEWRLLLSLPVEYRTLPGRGSISASSFALPQHIHLADAAFETDAVLAEQITHEFCHQWLYLIEEFAPLQHRNCRRRVTLPSGTGNRTVSELLGALHVTAALRRIWGAMPVPEEIREARLCHLEGYVAGCLELAEKARTCMSDCGSLLAERLYHELLQ